MKETCIYVSLELYLRKERKEQNKMSILNVVCGIINKAADSEVMIIFHKG
jgi:hypothetical protein